MQNLPVRKNDRNFWDFVEIWCPVRCLISLILVYIFFNILWLEAPSLTLWVCRNHNIFLQGIVPHQQDYNLKSHDKSLNIKTLILKVSIPVSISRLESWKSRYQSRYQDCNFKSLNTSLNTKTAVLKVSITVSISRLDFQMSRYQSRYQDSIFKSLDTSLDIKTRFLKGLIPVLILKLDFQKSWSRSQ